MNDPETEAQRLIPCWMPWNEKEQRWDHSSEPVMHDDDEQLSRPLVSGWEWRRCEIIDTESHAQEKAELESTLDLMRDEFARIKALAPSEEIIGLCDRAVSNITQHTSLIEQRDKALSDLQECRRAIQFKDEAEQQEMDQLRQDKAELERKLAEMTQLHESQQQTNRALLKQIDDLNQAYIDEHI